MNRNGEFLLNGAFYGPSNRRAHANTAISNSNPGQRVQNWPETRLWLWYRCLGGISRGTLGSINNIEQSLTFVSYLNTVAEQMHSFTTSVRWRFNSLKECGN